MNASQRRSMNLVSAAFFIERERVCVDIYYEETDSLINNGYVSERETIPYKRLDFLPQS